MQTTYVVDTTILVSWLLDPDKLTGKIVRSLDLELHTPYMAVSELWKHRDDWSRRKPSIDLQQFTSAIGYYVNVVQPDQYAQEMSEAKAVMGRIDPDDCAVHGFDFNEKAGLMSYLANDFDHLDDVYVSALDGSGERQLTHVNEKLWSELTLAKVERLPYKSTDGWDIDGFIVKPINWEPGKKYPMILSIHGGPAGQYGVDWYHEFQVYAGQGYAVFFSQSARLHRLRPQIRARHRQRTGAAWITRTSWPAWTRR